MNSSREEERRKALRASVEAQKNFDPMQILDDLNDYAVHACKLGIKSRNPKISAKELLEELRRVLAM